MPVTINEMEITVTVIPDPPSTGSAASSSNENAESDRRSMVEQCIEQMMQIINNKNER